MAEVQVHRDTEHPNISGSTVLYATIASLVIGGPLLGMMGFSLLATTALVLVAAPLMLLLIPVTVPAGLVLLLPWSVSASPSAWPSSLKWALRNAGVVSGGLGRVLGMVREPGGRVKEQGMDFGGYLKERREAYEPRDRQNRA